ncbi:MAG: Gfo/Idh/MocA family oxidoreductase [Anaerolineae bacterium]|nr:Gfo/Idh/MocA family oxidoreductase [Anaerolineae bacterium]
MAKLNIAVIGAGYWGPNLIRNVAQIPSAQLHTLCDRDQRRLAQIAQQYAPLHQTSEPSEVFSRPDIDGVIIATPAHTHFEITQQALEAGKHVLVEKPLALTSNDARELIALAESQHCILMVGHVFEYNPSVHKLRDLVKSGELGQIYYIYSTRVNLGKIRDDLNAFWNLAAHDVSIINMLLDEMPRRVAAHGFSYLQPALEDVVFAVLEYESGVAAHIHTSWLDPNKVRQMTVVGEKKMVVYDDVSDNPITIYDKGAAWVEDASSFGIHRLQTFTGDIYIPRLPTVEPLRMEVEHFLDCIRTGETPLSDGYDGLRVVQVLEAVSESLRKKGSPVEL